MTSRRGVATPRPGLLVGLSMVHGVASPTATLPSRKPALAVHVDFDGAVTLAA